MSRGGTEKTTPIIRGIGYIGVGPHVYDPSNPSVALTKWRSMISRCYGKSQRSRDKTYTNDCFVCDEWHNFQAFADWIESQNGYVLGWQLDKDLLVKWNKEYRPDRCCLLPRDVNAFLLRRSGDRGPWPIGVTYHEKGKRFFAQLSIDKKQTVIGTFDNPMDAFAAYKLGKEREAKKLANRYEGVLSPSAYNALFNFTVELGD